jgi:hypothetical protein
MSVIGGKADIEGQSYVAHVQGNFLCYRSGVELHCTGGGAGPLEDEDNHAAAALNALDNGDKADPAPRPCSVSCTLRAKAHLKKKTLNHLGTKTE